MHGVRIHDARHTYTSQGSMNGVGLTAMGKLLAHPKHETTAIYAHLHMRSTIPDHIEILVISRFHRRFFQHMKKFLNSIAFAQLFTQKSSVVDRFLICFQVNTRRLRI